MKELIEYRTKLIARLVAAAHEFRTECLAIQDASLPLEADGWTIHQIAAHTRDVDKLVYGLRAHRTAAEHNPEFQNFDGEQYMPLIALRAPIESLHPLSNLQVLLAVAQQGLCFSIPLGLSLQLNSR